MAPRAGNRPAARRPVVTKRSTVGSKRSPPRRPARSAGRSGRGRRRFHLALPRALLGAARCPGGARPCERGLPVEREVPGPRPSWRRSRVATWTSPSTCRPSSIARATPARGALRARPSGGSARRAVPWTARRAPSSPAPNSIRLRAQREENEGRVVAASPRQAALRLPHPADAVATLAALPTRTLMLATCPRTREIVAVRARPAEAAGGCDPTAHGSAGVPPRG